jgi:hypothetical protein
MFKLSTKLIASLNKANYSSKKTKKRNKKRWIIYSISWNLKEK